MRVSALPATVAVAALTLTGCVANAPVNDSSGPQTIAVTSTDDACTVSSNTVTAGTITFHISNEGPQTTEFYLLSSDGVRIVAEKENIAPGATVDLAVALQPGDYRTACKPGMRGDSVGEAAFTVTGEAADSSGANAALLAQAVEDYLGFVKKEVAALQPKVTRFANAYAAGDDQTARKLFAGTRVHYERIEPIAESLGILDPRIDYREIDYRAEAKALAQDDPTFTEWLGFHRIEKDLWTPSKSARQPDGSPAWKDWSPSTPAQRKQLAAGLIADVNTLNDTVTADDFSTSHGLDISTVSNGAAGLLEEIAVGKVTGEEDWWSHTDLYDFQANLDGARVAFELVAPIAERSGETGTELVASITTEFDALQALLDQYGSLQHGFVSYDTVTEQQRRALVEQIDATREPLSKLTNAVLGLN